MTAATRQAPGGERIRTAFWTLSDQAAVSIGAFAANVTLARRLPTADYGTVGLLFSGILMGQMVFGSLVFHPLSIRGSVIVGRARAELASASLIVGALLSAPLGAILCLMLGIAGRPDLIAPALCLFLAWQLQETLRRNLLSELRFRTATIGDMAAYLGQAVLALALAAAGLLTLKSFLWSAAGLFLAAAGIQATQIPFALASRERWRSLGHDFWAAGSWSLLSNAVSIARLQTTPWLLASLHGPGGVALLQAASNVVNLVNPVLTALCNVIPQAAARESGRGATAAWRAARHYALLGLPLVLLTLAFTLAEPELLLRTIYGANSPFAALGQEVRILVFAAAMGFVTETTCSYFHGIDRARSAFVSNAAGALACLLAIPLIWTRGVVGACLAIAAIQAIRLLTAQIVLARTIAADVERPA